MLLTHSTYFLFLACVFFLYWPLARWRALSLGVLLFANYFFYAKWDLFYLALIPAAGILDFGIALGIDAAKAPWLRRLLVTLSVLLNVGLLAAFKYVPFLLENYARVAGTVAPAWHWTFPLGLSFYCFQALTYTLDVYRRDAKPVRSLLAYLTAVSFFPTILSGPITRVATLTGQLEKSGRALAASDGGRALFRIALGLIKKFLIADYLAENLVNRVFDFPNLYSSTEVLVAVYGYALQLYYDFSGYTDIAIGSALLVGLKLPENFNAPYAALNLADFWRRWHISLSNWLRDYLYFSLPGQRSKVMPYFSLIITMVIGGFWHGPSWTFVAWGLLHGVGLAVVRLWQAWRGSKPAAGALRIWYTFLTVQFVCLCWVFFRAASLENAWLVLERIGSLSLSFSNISASLWFILVLAAGAHYIPKKWFDFSLDLYAKAPFYVQAACLAALVIALQFVATTGTTPFIYNNF